MQGAKKVRIWMIGGFVSYVCLVLALSAVQLAGAAQPVLPADEGVPQAFSTPTYSSPIALSADAQQIWVVNPDDDSVSIIGNLDGNLRVLRKIFVGDEPQSVALDSISTTRYNAYVANAAGNSVTIINVNTSGGFSAVKEKTLITGSEPWNAVASPDGRRVFVANSVQDTITVIRTDTREIIGHINLRNTACSAAGRHFQPRGMAVTLNNDRLYVTSLLAFTGGSTPGQANNSGKVATICQLSINTSSNTIGNYRVERAITLGAQPSGFANESAYPNQLQSIVIRGNQAYLPNIAAAPAAPLRFNADTHAFVNVLDNVTTGTPTDASAAKFLNLHLGARDPETGKQRLFFANPWAIAFTTPSGTGAAYVVSAGSDLLVKVNVDAAGKLAFTGDISTTRYIDLNDPGNPATSGVNAGKNPLGIVIRNISPDNNRAFVLNYISRNLSVVDLSNDTVTQVLRVTDLPPAGSTEEQLQVGAEVFFSSRGVFNQGKVNRLSSEGWQNCASCHFAGLTDGNIWQFGSGPRKSVPLNVTWSPHNPDDQRILNYSGIFDEVQDFELNIRNVSGPGPLSAGPPPVLDPNHGLLIGNSVDTAPAAVPPLIPIANAGRPQLTITLPGSSTAWPALDAMKEWVRFAIRTPNGMLTNRELVAPGSLNASDVEAGRRLFFRARCQSCHGGTKWTISNKDFTSPPLAGEVATEPDTNGDTTPNPNQGQYLARFLRDIGSFNLNVAGAGNILPGQPAIGGIEKDAGGRDALGLDYNRDGRGAGFNIPGLLAIWHVPPYYHNGACETLDCVLRDVKHRTANGTFPDVLSDQTSRDRVVAFLQSLDAQTDFPTDLYVDRHDIFVDPPRPLTNITATVGANISLFGTRADLADLVTDGSITVRFSGTSVAFNPAEIALPVSAFTQDFGQVPISTTAIFNDDGIKIVVVEIDTGDELFEANERKNRAARIVRVQDPPPDTTPPVVESVAISDDDPFNDNDPLTGSANVRIKFRASDPDNPPAQTSGLRSFCIVHYFYNTALRRWIEERCTFASLPSPQSDGSYIVNARLQPREGVSYAFVWVRDAAGNISRRPGFDFITFAPLNTPIFIRRNDIYLLRFRDVGQQLNFTFTPSLGDIDISVFDTDGNRIAVSAQNGTQPETASVPAGGFVQIEIRAVANSIFTISQTTAQIGAEVAQEVIDPGKDVPTTPINRGPPALQTAIDDQVNLFIPIVQR